MCVAAIAWQAHPRWRLAVIANRDEYHHRPTAPLARWSNGTLAGRDLQAGGTWLGVGPDQRFALVTNFRVEGFPRPELASRGRLVSDWIEGSEPGGAAGMNPFHLIRTDRHRALHLTNHPRIVDSILSPGVHGVSNGAFDQPWPKTQRLCRALAEWLAKGDDAPAPLFAALADESPLPAEPDSEGPDQPFSPVFIRHPEYGTRCSTVVLIDHDGAGQVIERSFDAEGSRSGEVALEIA